MLSNAICCADFCQLLNWCPDVMCKLQVETFERRTKKNYVWIKKGIITQKIKLDCNSRFGISHSIMVSENCNQNFFFFSEHCKIAWKLFSLKLISQNLSVLISGRCALTFSLNGAVKFWNLNDNQTHQHVLMIQDHSPISSFPFMRFQETS